MSSNKYGYIADTGPEQAFRSNTGVFNPADINELIAEDKWTNFGQLELIETQTYSSAVTNIDFTSIKESEYNVHFFTVKNLKNNSSSNASVLIRLFESGTIEAGSVYQYAFQYGGASGSFGEARSTGASFVTATIGLSTTTNASSNLYGYFYNLGDSSKYSFLTFQESGVDGGSGYFTQFGSGVLPQTSTVDGIRFTANTSTFADFDISLYGIKEYS